MTDLPPALIFFLGAVVVAVLPKKLRSVACVLVPVVSGACLWSFYDRNGLGSYAELEYLEQTLTLFRFDALALIFCVLFHAAAFVGMIFAFNVTDRVQQVAATVYAGSALGAVCAGDLVTLFLSWELLAFSSLFLIWARRTESSKRAGLRYFFLQLASGLLVINGLVLQYLGTGSIAFEAVALGNDWSVSSIGTWCLFLGFGIKAGFPGLHTWITDGYPAGTPSGSVFLSGFTTKVAIYAFARAFVGEELLIWIGAAMAVFPIFYAVIENDLRRVLGYSMINQLGFMCVGIGIGTDLAVNGAVAHAFNDVFFKGLLFMTMGAVLMRTGNINGSDLGGLYKTMPKTTGFCMVGAASISAFPLFSGFASKSMIMVAAAEEHYTVVWFMLLFAAAGVFHHAGIKIPFFAFFGHDSKRRVPEAPRAMLIAMALAAVVCVFNGTFPHLGLYELLPLPNSYDPYDTFHVITQLQILFFSALAFAVLMLTKVYPPELHSVNLDVDWLIRRPGKAVAMFFVRPFLAIGDHVSSVGRRAPRILHADVFRRLERLTFLEETVLLVMLLLLSFLLVLFFL